MQAGCKTNKVYKKFPDLFAHQHTIEMAKYRIMMIQKEFAERVVEIVKSDPSVIGLAVAGSWLTNELDEFSDLDLILVTEKKISGDKVRMLAFAQKPGNLISAFTGEHVGEPRLLICLYDKPLLHVDIKFVTREEFGQRIETPAVIFDREGQLEQIINTTEANFPYPDFQWIEDRFWTWVHYALLKIGRGEYFEALDFFGSIRMMVLGPLLHIKNGNLPKGVRKVETKLAGSDLEQLKGTLASYNRQSLLEALENSITLYQNLKKQLFNRDIKPQTVAEEKVMEFLQEIKNQTPGEKAEK